MKGMQNGKSVSMCTFKELYGFYAVHINDHESFEKPCYLKKKQFYFMSTIGALYSLPIRTPNRLGQL